jgi:hypothetical protein
MSVAHYSLYSNSHGHITGVHIHYKDRSHKLYGKKGPNVVARTELECDRQIIMEV